VPLTPLPAPPCLTSCYSREWGTLAASQGPPGLLGITLPCAGPCPPWGAGAGRAGGERGALQEREGPLCHAGAAGAPGGYFIAENQYVVSAQLRR